jgi:hypothetical protein
MVGCYALQEYVHRSLSLQSTTKAEKRTWYQKIAEDLPCIRLKSAIRYCAHVLVQGIHNRFRYIYPSGLGWREIKRGLDDIFGIEKDVAEFLRSIWFASNNWVGLHMVLCKCNGLLIFFIQSHRYLSSLVDTDKESVWFGGDFLEVGCARSVHKEMNSLSKGT